jgi:DNA-binding CsgD family transcriptional regulator
MREIEVLNGISEGLTTKEIANNLYLSDHTIISYRKSLFEKLDALNAPSLVRKGFELGVLVSN